MTIPAVTITISDQATLAHAKAAAKQAGYEQDWVSWLREQARTGTRMALGMQADLSVSDAARYTGLCRNTIWNYAKQGRLPNLYYVSAKKAMIPIKDLDAIRAQAA